MSEFISHTILLVSQAAEAAQEALPQAAEAASKSGGEADVIGMLGLNWKLFIAQLINFSLILFILWKWIFNPVTTALQNRTKKIEQSLAQAKEIERRVAELEEYKKQQITKARQEYEEIIAKAETAANQQKQEIVEAAKQQSKRLIEETERKLASEKERLLAEIKEEVADLAIMMAEKIISEKLDKKKDERLIKEILKTVK